MIMAGVGWWWDEVRTDYNTGVGWALDQPVSFRHEHYVAGLGTDHIGGRKLTDHMISRR